MKEIKFRAWDYDNEKMYSDDMIIIDNGTVFIGKIKYLHQISQDTELLQFTGLKDKNGVEIFEGDMLKFIPDNIFGEVKVFNKSLCMGVEWVNCKTSHFTLLFYMQCEKELEVIGNIYENQELLELI